MTSHENRSSFRSVALLALVLLIAGSGPATAQLRRPLRGGWTVAAALPSNERPPADDYVATTVVRAMEQVLGSSFDGVAWYRRTLRVTPSESASDLSLRIAAAATHCTVYCDGQRLGEHLGGWTPFRVALPRLAAGVDHLLELEVDERVGHNTQGFLPIIQPHFGGIWQGVELLADRGPVLDHDATLTFAHLQHESSETTAVEVGIALRNHDGAARCNVLITVRDGTTTLAQALVAAPTDPMQRIWLTVPGPVRPWRPGAPNLYGVELKLRHADGTTIDTLKRRIGFRHVAADGRRITLNGMPLSVRGVLHWGVAPSYLAPNPGRKFWRKELESIRALGFNLVKCCLWVPAPPFYELCDELGLLVWQEYPTWHPDLTEKHRRELLREFEEFYRHDRSHPSVVFRSLTCETGHGAELGVLQALYDRAHAVIPNSLIIDDSSWITWSRVGDFYDDHPYGNNTWWPGKLAEFDAYIAAHRPKPLLLGECIASDTWFDAAAWQEQHGKVDRPPFWQAWCIDDQARFLRDLHATYTDAPRPQQLLAESLREAVRNRKFQIERLRMSSPATGYVVSVLRDFGKARMGLIDDLGRLKFDASAWDWHRDTLIGLDRESDHRSFAGHRLEVPLRIAHHGPSAVRGTLQVEVQTGAQVLRATLPVPNTAPGTVTPRMVAPFSLDAAPATGPSRVRVEASLVDEHGQTVSRNHWDLWRLPSQRQMPPAAAAIRIVDHLDSGTWAWLRDGGRVLLRNGSPRPGSWRTQGLWYLRGKAFTPTAHPVHEDLPSAFLRELQTFDLERPHALAVDLFDGSIDPILAFWDTHDLKEVRSYAFAFDTAVGKGRLAVHTLNHQSPAGQFVEHTLRRHLATGPPPRRSLSPDAVESIGAELVRAVIDVPSWHLRPDPDDRGRAQGWATAAVDASWHAVRAGSHWENQGWDGLDGTVWYQADVVVPKAWADTAIHGVFDGVDDSFELYADGELVAKFGDPKIGKTVWLERVSADLSARAQAAARSGRPLHLALRVVDHGGAGGLWKPVRLQTGPLRANGDWLHH